MAAYDHASPALGGRILRDAAGSGHASGALAPLACARLRSALGTSFSREGGLDDPTKKGAGSMNELAQDCKEHVRAK